jgi:predicted DNA-binding transcriptional regulator AlpA
MDAHEPKRHRAERAASYLGVSRSTLAKWRMSGVGPPYHRCGPRIVYYLEHELDGWLHECDRKIHLGTTSARSG